MRIDVEIHHLEKFTQLEFSDVKVIAKGPLRAAVSACVRFGKSTATVTVCPFFLGVFFLFVLCLV